jgi:hypothetical protein
LLATSARDEGMHNNNNVYDCACNRVRGAIVFVVGGARHWAGRWEG